MFGFFGQGIIIPWNVRLMGPLKTGQMESLD